MIIIKELNGENALNLPTILKNSEIESPFIIKSDLEWVRPYGMLLTSKTIKDFRNLHPEIDFNLSIKESAKAHSYACHMGFYNSISDKLEIGKKPGEASGSDKYLPITELDLLKLHQEEIEHSNYCELHETIENLASKLSKILSGNNEEFHKLLTYLIREILRNIPEHSESNTAWICGQSWSNGDAEIAIIDNGIGVKSSLQKNSVHKKYIFSDKDALEWALQPGISKAFSPKNGNKSDDVWSNSGFGLYTVSEICIKLGGSFTIASGEQFIEIDSNGDPKLGETSVIGTAIKINLNYLKLDSSYKKIISQVVKNGEIRAKQIKNNFKKASIPSKGLIK